jgi:hypothetical protein
MRTINIIEQDYQNYGIVNKLSYEILPFDEINFPFNYILYNNDIEVVNSIDYLTEEEFNDWSVFELMDTKIENKIGLFVAQNNEFAKVYNLEQSNEVTEENSNIKPKIKFNLIRYIISIIKKLKRKIKLLLWH